MVDTEKEFKKLTIEQFRNLVGQLPEVRSQMRELPRLISQKKEKLKELLGVNYHWASIYEQPFIRQIAYLFVLLGLGDLLAETANSDDPQEQALQWSSVSSELDQWYEANEDTVDKKHLVWLSIVMQRNILSIMLYHCSLGALVEKVRQGGPDANEALFKAIRVDRSILSCPTIADRLAFAELTNDRDFFIHLRSALKGPSRKHMEALKDLRYAIAVLREMGFDSLSDAQLEDLFVNRLKLYPKHPSARKNLRKHMYEAKRVSTTLS